MPINADDPVVRVPMLPETEGESDTKRRQEPSHRQVVTPADPVEWRSKLPEWLGKSEPAKKPSAYWSRWYVFTRTGEYKTKNVRIPNFIDYQAALNDNSDHIRTNRPFSQTTICVTSGSGGMAKSTTAALLGAELRESTGMPVFLYDGDTSDPNLMGFFHLDDKETLHRTITGLELAEILKTKTLTYEEYVYRNNGRYVAFDKDSVVGIINAEEGISLDTESSMRIVTEGKKACHTFISDTEPGTGDRAGTVGLVAASDIIIVPGKADESKMIGAIEKTLNYEEYGLRDPDRKGKNVILAIGSVSPGDFNLKTQYRFAERYKVSVEQVVLIPYSGYVRKAKSTDDIVDQMTNKIMLRMLDMRTRYGVSQLGRVVTDMAIRINTEKLHAETEPSNQPLQLADWPRAAQQTRVG